MNFRMPTFVPGVYCHSLAPQALLFPRPKRCILSPSLPLFPPSGWSPGSTDWSLPYHLMDQMNRSSHPHESLLLQAWPLIRFFTFAFILVWNTFLWTIPQLKGLLCLGFKARSKATSGTQKQVFLCSLHPALSLKYVSGQTCCRVFFRVFVTEVVVRRNTGGWGVDCLLSSGGPSLLRLIVITVNKIGAILRVMKSVEPQPKGGGLQMRPRVK